MKYNVKYLFGLLMALSFTHLVAQPTVRFDATKTHQHITGFGGFVCSPQFQYGHMSTADIKKVWGPESTVGCNIMRMYIPIGKNTWSQSVQTAKTAKQMGLIVCSHGAPGVRSGLIDLFPKDKNRETEVRAASVSLRLGF